MGQQQKIWNRWLQQEIKVEIKISSAFIQLLMEAYLSKAADYKVPESIS